ncbi:MAG: right-handed parallel beta-helix repeat-containing protein [Phycisphaerales bacterium]|nr:right-handed parallel beta-helix repeat-containing protein [Phycisphaerales bacterium]
MNTPRLMLTLSMFTLVAGSALGGPLNPPLGAVTSTMKTLEQIEPRVMLSSETTPGDADSQFKITSPGSYYLNGSMTISSGRMFIEVAASNVTIDLSGFRVNGASGALTGIYGASGTRNVVVRNGTITGFNQGIDMFNTSIATIEDVQLLDTVGDGLTVGPSSKVLRVSVQDAGEDGFTGYGGTIMRDCTAYSCGNYGYYAGGAVSFQGCTARDNASAGFYVTTGSSVIGCEASGNLGWGIGTIANSDGVTIADSTVIVPNAGSSHGIGVFNKSTIRNNTVTNNRSGAWTLYVNEGNRVEGNTTSGGLQAVTAGGNKNLIIGNFHTGASAIGAFTVGGSNAVGPVVSATGTISSTNPWANFWLP